MGGSADGIDFLAIRQRSVARLGTWALSDAGNLPLHGDEDFDWVRPASVVVARCHAIAGALALLHRAPVESVRRAVDDHGLEAVLGARELELLQHFEGRLELDRDTLEQLRIDVSWREEALHALLWTLRLVDDLPPDRMCPRQPAYEQLAPGLAPANAGADQALRPLAELAAMLDLYYCLHWTARKAQYHGDVWDYKISPGVVLERRRALEWLFQDVPWEDVDLGV